jgi:type I restriction enzyme, S subunit
VSSGSFNTVTLGDVCSSVDYGYTASASSNPDVGPKFLRITDIVPENLVWDSVPHCEIEPNKREKFLLIEGDIVVARTGATVGYAKQIWARPEGATFASYLVRFRPDGERVDPRYLGQIVQSAEFKRWVKSVAGGAAQPNANAKVLGSYELHLPPIAQQEVVGRVLWAFDDLIENNRRRIEILEEMARLLYREWFVHFRFPGHEDVELVDSELGPIPEGWEVATFADLAEFVNGFAFKSSEHWQDEGLPIVKIKELKAGVTAETPRYHGDDIKARYFVDDRDVLFSWSADLDAYVWSGGPALLNQHLFVVRPYELPSLFVFHSLKGRMEQFRARAQGTTMKHIKRSALNEVSTVVPHARLIAMFDDTVGPMLDLQVNLTRQNRVLREARDLLLPRLVSGELDVSELDLDGVLA